MFKERQGPTHPETRLAARTQRRIENLLDPGRLGLQIAASISLQQNTFHRDWYPRPKAQVNEKNTVRVMHWNILADKLAYPDFKKGGFGCDLAVLNWNQRKEKIYAEILKHNPDILITVELDHYEDLSYVLEEDYGYKSVWEKKNRMFYSDGTGIFWKDNRFNVEKVVKTPLRKSLGDEQFVDQVLVAVKLCPNSSMNDFTPFVVAGIHLKSTNKAKGEKVRLDQCKQVLEILDSEFKDVPIVLGADLNA